MARMARIGTLAAVAASLLATSMPAEARRGWYGGGGYGGGYRNRGHDVSVGDLLLGAVVVGGVLVGADALAKSRNRELDGIEPGAGARVHGDRNVAARGGTAGVAENAAVDACAAAAERQYAGRDADARVESIDLAQRDGQGWRVEGSIAGRDFVCGARDGRADFVQIGERTIERSAYRR